MNRQSNIELLRLIMMFFIIIGHLNKGAISSIESLGGVRESLSEGYGFIYDNLLSTITAIGVDTFVLISGYFGIRYNLKSLIALLMQTSYYSILILLFMCFLGLYTFTLQDIKFLFPISSGVWWFISSYMALFAISPLINKSFEILNRYKLKSITLGLLILNCFSCFLFTNPFIGFDGYSFFNLMTLYVLGRYIAKYKVSIKHPLLVFSVCCLIVCLINVSISIYANKPLRPASRYCDILIILMSVCMFLIFLQLKLKSNFVNVIAKSSLSIYLIHVHPTLFRYVLDLGKWINLTFNQEVIITLSLKFVFAFAIGFACILIDQIRVKLFSLIMPTIENNFSKILNGVIRR